jgi:hypothetical protein
MNESDGTATNTLYMSVLPNIFRALNESMCVAKPNTYNHSLATIKATAYIPKLIVL